MSRGSPPTAGVGCRRPASASSPASSRSVPVIGVTRCWTWRSGRIPGASATVSVSTIGARSARSVSTTTACSSRSFSLARRAAAKRASDSGSAPRGAEPAIATVSNDRPTVRARRSGVAPRNVVPSRVKAKVVLSGRGRGEVPQRGRDVEVGGRFERDATRQDDLVDPAAPDRTREHADGPLPGCPVRALVDDPERAVRSSAAVAVSRRAPRPARSVHACSTSAGSGSSRPGPARSRRSGSPRDPRWRDGERREDERRGPERRPRVVASGRLAGEPESTEEQRFDPGARRASDGAPGRRRPPRSGPLPHPRTPTPARCRRSTVRPTGWSHSAASRPWAEAAPKSAIGSMGSIGHVDRDERPRRPRRDARASASARSRRRTTAGVRSVRRGP